MAADVPSGAPAAVDHPLVPSEEPVLVETDEAVASMVDEIRSAGRFAFDTEFIGEETYYPNLCVLQLATSERVWLVDALLDLDLGPIWELIADPSLVTLVHAGQQDLEPVVRLLGKAPANIIDTQLAAAFTARPYPLGLRGAVEECLHFRLGKGLTFTRWDQRPLSAAHQRYAADDVRYLLAVAAHFEDELDAARLLSVVQEACAESTRPECYTFDANQRALRLAGNRTLDRKTSEMLRRLVSMRDEVARRLDQPPRAVLRDEVVVRIAKTAPKTRAALDGIKGLPRPLIDSEGETMLEIVAEVKATAKSDLPDAGPPEESTAERFAIDALHGAAMAHCASRGIDPSVVTTRRDLARWYMKRTGRWQTDLPHALDSGWRANVLGQWLSDFLGGTQQLSVVWSAGLRVNDGA